MISNKDIGLNIKRIREAHGETQRELAEALNVKRETVNQWEKGTRDLKTAYTIALAEHYKITCDEILLGVTSDNTDVHFELGLNNDVITSLKDIIKEGGYDFVNELIHLILYPLTDSILFDVIELSDRNQQIIDNDTIFNVPVEYLDRPLECNNKNTMEIPSSDIFDAVAVPNHRYIALLLYEIQTKFMNGVKSITHFEQAENVIKRCKKEYQAYMPKILDTEV